ncbi:MAG: FliM/FliN family flagellar motor switch protein [Acidobacteriaceae bacterium]
MTIPAANTDKAPSISAGLLHDPQQWGPMLELSCNVTLEVAIPHFTVADLLRLEAGTVLDSKWPQGEDVPVRINGQLVAWAEFEVIDGKLAMRITEWA